MPWVAGSEPDALKAALGFLSTNLPERYGVDILWRARGSFCGAQRKEVSDLLASVADGRLAKEVQQMDLLKVRFLIVEGTVRFTTDDVLLKTFGRPWTGQQYRSVLRGVAAKGVIVEHTASLTDTARRIPELIRWTSKEHRSLQKRPGPAAAWGKADNRDFQLHLLQGLPGMGPELAERILEHIGMPFGWAVSREELLQVPGIGKKKVEAIFQALNCLPMGVRVADNKTSGPDLLDVRTRRTG